MKLLYLKWGDSTYFVHIQDRELSGKKRFVGCTVASGKRAVYEDQLLTPNRGALDLINVKSPHTCMSRIAWGRTYYHNNLRTGITCK